ncbi:MAG TPA: GlsB/YeaQ/YmgE family stress response membrane protein [Blastocatellia bacterium]|nr:GlsB/YeaQ/YmgE family stress response membrane protein [Blastocatellia bacterium]
MMTYVWWVIIGLVVGLLARLIMPGKDSMGIIATILLGIAGSFVGGLVSWVIWGQGRAGGFHTSGFLLSLVGAIVLLILWRLIKGGR